MSAWQPIETAPKDGTRIVVLLEPKQRCSVNVTCVQWKDFVTYEDEKLSSEWLDDDGHMVESYHRATHWMPLPNSPTK